MVISRRKIGQGIGQTSSARGASPILDRQPQAGVLSITGYAPTTSTQNPGGQTIICDPVAPGRLRITGYAPRDNQPGIGRPPAGTLEIVGYAPGTGVSAPMALDTYDNITAALMRQTHYDDLTADIDDLFRQGESRIYRRLRLRTMETKLSVTISTNGAPVPTDYIELIWAHTLLNSNVMELKKQTPEWIYRNYRNRGGEAQPRYFARDGDDFIFGPAPDKDYLLQGRYYRRLQTLQSTSTSWFTENAPDLLMAAAKAEIYEFKEDFESAAVWQNRFELTATRIEHEETREHRKGSPISEVPDMAYR